MSVLNGLEIDRLGRSDCLDLIQLYAQKSLLAFVVAIMPGFQVCPFHRHLGGTLEKVTRGDIKNLIAHAPPRHGKSTLVTEAWSSWQAGHGNTKTQKHEIMTLCYNDRYATRFGLRNRDIFSSEMFKWIFPDFPGIRQDSASAQMFTLRNGAEMTFSGRTGTITGRGADTIIKDDVIKNADEANSSENRANLREWFDDTIFDRRNNEGVPIVSAQTKWHYDDLPAHLEEKYADLGWTKVIYKALAEENDILGRNPGEALWPEKFSPKYLLMKRRLNPGTFAALFQSDPIVGGDGQLRDSDFGRERLPRIEDFECIYATLDCASKDDKSNSRWAGQIIGELRGRFYVLDGFAEHMVYHKGREFVTNWLNRWRPNYVLVEDKSTGTQLIQHLRRLGKNVIAINPQAHGGVKLTKSERHESHTVPAVKAGRVILPTQGSWIEEFIRELTRFPKYAWDDQVDCLSQFLRWKEPERAEVTPMGGSTRPTRDVEIIRRARTRMVTSGRYVAWPKRM